MKIWQISPFRGGWDDDIDYWRACVKNEMISIWWNDLGDLREYKSPYSLSKALKKKINSNDVRSCWSFCWVISKGDIIVSKKGGKDGGVYGIGKVLSGYEFIDKPPERLGKQIIRIKWEKPFDKLLQLGMNFYIPTVGLFDDEKYEQISKLLNKSQNTQNIVEHSSEGEIKQSEEIDLDEEGKTEIGYLEGRQSEAKILRSSRNRKAVDEKKRTSDYTCEVCKINFREKYGEIGNKYIVAHHKNPMHHGERITKSDDLALVCDNCHRMLHRQNPPYTPEELKSMIKNLE